MKCTNLCVFGAVNFNLLDLPKIFMTHSFLLGFFSTVLLHLPNGVKEEQNQDRYLEREEKYKKKKEDLKQLRG